jgi:CDP-glucose 4,6-dehydratase
VDGRHGPVGGVVSSFWRGKRVLVTGHTGFKGGWLSAWLVRLGASVTGYALDPPTSPSLFGVTQLAKRLDSVIADIRDIERLKAVFKKARPEVVFHLAAQPLVSESYADPVATYDVNIMGVVHVLQAVRSCADTRVVVNVTSDKCYRNNEWAWGYRETDVLGGHDPYSSSKACAEIVTEAFRRSFFAPGGHKAAIASARAGNVIGGGDWAKDRLIPDIFRAWQAHEPLKLRHPSSVRPWQHVLEPLRGYLMLAERLSASGASYSEAWNFGPRDDDCRTVGWIVDWFARRLRAPFLGTARTESAFHEAGVLKLDHSKATQRLGWRPRWDLVTALESVVEWHEQHATAAHMMDLLDRQIAAYENADGAPAASANEVANA